MQRGTQGNINIWITLFLIFLYVCVIVDFIIEASGHPIRNEWDTLLMMGYAKAAITFVKYVPQVILNYRRKSTVGWSLANVLLDFTGGSLSLLQSVINSVAFGEPFFQAGAFNLVKFILSIMSIFFDSIFMFQHFVLYRDAHGKKLEKSKEAERDDALEKRALTNDKLQGVDGNNLVGPGEF